MATFTWLQALQVVVTVGGFAFAIWQLRTEYRWRRRQFARHVLAEWNDKTGAHRRGVEQGLPGLLDADAESPARLRIHIVELLNYSECVAVSYAEEVGDRRVLMASLGRTVTRWYRRREPYLLVTARHRGFDPWKPLGEFVGEVERSAGTTRGRW